MEIKELESKIVELKGKQSDYFKKKKANRNPEELEAIRKELNELKEQAKGAYRGRQKEKRIARSSKQAS